MDTAPEERTEVVPRGFFEIGRRNMWGKNRSVNFFTRVSLRSRDAVSDSGAVSSSYGVNEYRVYGTYREPKLFGTPGVVVLTGIAERAIRASFSFVTREVREELVVQPSRIYSAVFRHSIERTELFDIDPNDRPAADRPGISAGQAVESRQHGDSQHTRRRRRPVAWAVPVSGRRGRGARDRV